MADRVQISLDETAQALWDKMEDEIKNIYENGGRSEFFRDMLYQYADKKTRLEVRRDLLEDKLQVIEDRKQKLERDKKIVEQKIQELGVEDDKIIDHDDSDFWDETVNILADNGSDFKKRYRKYFDGRLKAYRKRFDSVSEKTFKQKLADNLRSRGFDSEADMLDNL